MLVPVDGTYTLNHASMIEVIKDLRAKLVIPMHYFSTSGLKSFVDALSGAFEVEIHKTAQVTVSDSTLPKSTKVLVLPGH